jgi:hypothetical protein
MSYGYRTYRQPDRNVMFAVRYADESSAYFRVPKTVRAFGVTPVVVRMAHEAQAVARFRTAKSRRSSRSAEAQECGVHARRQACTSSMRAGWITPPDRTRPRNAKRSNGCG